ncbi:MAG: type II secretion system F family protein [Planctomycetes bacterium]|nr:type II secretion system F family protein [Planctomycetota bacterium]
MPVFEYQAMRTGGEPVSGIVTADSPRQAREQLRGKDIYVTSLKPLEQQARQTSLWRLPSSLTGRRLRDVGLATRQFATMLGSGLPLTEVLDVLIEQVEDRRLSRAFRDAREKVTRGYTLADALAAHPAYFDSLYVGMVRAGEATGHLDEVLGQIAEFCQKEYRMRSRVTAVLTYPCVLLVFGSAVVVFLLTFVVPRITAVLQENRVRLPTSTAILVGIADFLHAAWPLLLGGLAAGLFAFRAAARTEWGRWAIDSAKLRIPVVGELFRKQAVARFASTLAALLRSGLPALEALTIVRQVIDNQVIARSIRTVSEAVTAGQDISTPLRSAGVFPPMVAHMVATGEQSGHLEVVLDKVARELDEEVDLVGQRLIALLEPLLIIVMGVILAFIVLSVIQPILELSNF